jgi:hypothetical protein
MNIDLSTELSPRGVDDSKSLKDSPSRTRKSQMWSFFFFFFSFFVASYLQIWR